MEIFQSRHNLPPGLKDDSGGQSHCGVTTISFSSTIYLHYMWHKRKLQQRHTTAMHSSLVQETKIVEGLL